MTAGCHPLKGDPRPVPGFYAMTSPDLIRWSGYMRVMAAPLAPHSVPLEPGASQMLETPRVPARPMHDSLAASGGPPRGDRT